LHGFRQAAGKAPKSKLQRNIKYQTPKNHHSYLTFAGVIAPVLLFEYWSFFGVWCLEVGV
jgi:hypothetical protein